MRKLADAQEGGRQQGRNVTEVRKGDRTQQVAEVRDINSNRKGSRMQSKCGKNKCENAGKGKTCIMTGRIFSHKF